MDIIKFNNPTDPMFMQHGEFVNGIETKEWTERYRYPGDFKLTAPIHVDLREQLPVGTFITHTDTDDIMIVENHELSDEPDKDPSFVVSGRSLDAYFENRVIGAISIYSGYGGGTPPLDYMVWHPYPRSEHTDVKSYEAVRSLLTEAFGWGSSYDSLNPDTYHLYLRAYYGSLIVDPYPSVAEQEFIKSDEKDVLSNVHKFLEIDNFGLRIERPNRGEIGTNYQVLFYIHPGEDKTRQVVLSHHYGEIESANYLWSKKDYYNTVYIRTTHKAYMYRDSSISAIDRRIIYVDFPDVDAEEDPGDISWPEAEVLAGCHAKALETLNEHKVTETAAIEVSRNLSRYKFREDYKIGDLITVDLGYIPPEVRRVVEYVEIEDERGEVGYPILEAPNDKVYGYS